MKLRSRPPQKLTVDSLDICTPVQLLSLLFNNQEQIKRCINLTTINTAITIIEENNFHLSIFKERKVTVLELLTARQSKLEKNRAQYNRFSLGITRFFK